ncbi:MAG TPA: tripartite tricarboxylate transporter substrate-binding protein [Alphaproteobacteria bacterium]|nr:tripartite tricarboxylate transporter substrate-binding protein [Alphaproteobacteria bacterium]
MKTFESRIPSIRLLTAAVLAGAAALALPSTASAQQSAEQFYKGKTINLYIAFAPGGSYDSLARLTARYMGKHIPGNPNIVPQNMPGAGGFKAANFMYSVAPKDGTTMSILSQTAALEEALKSDGVMYKSNEFGWIGRFTSNIEVQVLWHTAKAKTIQDVLTNETSVASTGPGSPSDGYPRILNGMLGTKFKIIAGYPGSTDGLLAMERGEVDGALTSWNTMKTARAAWLKEKKASLLVQYVLERSPEIPDVPAVVEFGRTPEEKQVLATYASGGDIGRAFNTTPGVPAERLKALRAAFDDMVKNDKELLADIERMKLDFFPMEGEKLQALVSNTVSVPPNVVKRMQELLAVGK